MSIQAVVRRKRKARKGKGFSREELREVGLSFGEALRLGIPIDTRRSTKHDQNVESLNAYLSRDLRREVEVAAPEVAVGLTEVKGIGPKTAGRLKEAGIGTANELAASTPEKVAKAVGSSEEKASRFIEYARAVSKK